MINLPKKSSEYPFYVFCSWLVIWGAYFLLNCFILISNLTPDGQYVKKIEETTYFIATGQELTHLFINSGIIIGWATILGGSLLYVKKLNSEKSKK